MPPLVPRTRSDLSPHPWEPQFPDAAVGDKSLYRDPGNDSGAPWEHSPASSHVYGWKLLGGSAGGGGFVKKFYAPAAGAAAGTSVVLMVAFKPDAVNGVYPNVIETEYEYYFTSPAVAENYLAKFRTAEHPGHVVNELKAQGVAYKRVR
jgi:hypothetical protein